jgi:hypothetical protein
MRVAVITGGMGGLGDSIVTGANIAINGGQHMQ